MKKKFTKVKNMATIRLKTLCGCSQELPHKYPVTGTVELAFMVQGWYYRTRIFCLHEVFKEGRKRIAVYHENYTIDPKPLPIQKENR